MSNVEIGSLTLALGVIIASAHILGHIFTRLRQPRVVGEILAGIVLGPAVLGALAPGVAAFIFRPGDAVAAIRTEAVLGFVYWLGLLLLMFLSGAQIQRFLAREDRRGVLWMAVVGAALPFLVTVALTPWLPLERLMGPAGQRTSLILVLGIAVAVTSIPVISKILHDLKLLHTRFARLVLGVAVLQDIALWAVLAVATALAASAAFNGNHIAGHVAVTLAYLLLGLTVIPRLLRWLNRARWNLLATASPVAYLVAVLFAFTALARALNVELVFAAFLAGYATTSDRERFRESMESLSRVSFAVFIPVYFALVGYRLDLSRTFSWEMLALFAVGSSILVLGSVGLGAWLAGFRRLDIVNLAVATNARGGPGIVLASVAFDAGIINAVFYTTLVLTAVLTSQAAGAWLDLVLRRGWTLLAVPIDAAPGERSRESEVPGMAA